MSNADHSSGPGFGRPRTIRTTPTVDTAPEHQERSRAQVQPSTIVILGLVLIMIVATAVIPIVTPAVDRWLEQHGPPGHNVPHDPGPPVSTGDRNHGGPGLGDPYYPDYGSSGYDARGYAITINWQPREPAPLVGESTMDSVATRRLEAFYVDLVLPVRTVTVNGQPAAAHRDGLYDVKITPQHPISSGSRFSTVITYAGNPADYKISGARPWLVTGDEVTAAGEPEGAAWWYPGNDHPSDPADYRVTITVPTGMEAISNGALVSVTHDAQHDVDSWSWSTQGKTLDSYQSLLSIGQYELQQGTADGRPYVYAVSDRLSEDQRAKAFAALAQTPKIISDEETIYGPYPYDQIGGLVPAHGLWYDGLESATRPVYSAAAITGDDGAGLITHELAHMWFGDHVTLKQWDDIFISEAYASFTQWWRTAETGGTSADDQLQRTFSHYADKPRFWEISMIDPGRDHLFDAVYLRGPMTLQALRRVIGDDAFFRLSRQWAQRGGVHSLEEWMAMAQQVSGRDLSGFFQAWVYRSTAPARTPANGLA